MPEIDRRKKKNEINSWSITRQAAFHKFYRWCCAVWQLKLMLELLLKISLVSPGSWTIIYLFTPASVSIIFLIISLISFLNIIQEKILWEGEFTLRSDPWAGLIASCGSFYPMVCLSSDSCTALPFHSTAKP
jgi:hypothetical protein